MQMRCHVASWHKADVLRQSSDVRCSGLNKPKSSPACSSTTERPLIQQSANSVRDHFDVPNAQRVRCRSLMMVSARVPRSPTTTRPVHRVRTSSRDLRRCTSSRPAVAGETPRCRRCRREHADATQVLISASRPPSRIPSPLPQSPPPVCRCGTQVAWRR